MSQGSIGCKKYNMGSSNCSFCRLVRLRRILTDADSVDIVANKQSLRFSSQK